MTETHDNPESNRLQAGVTAEDLEAAVRSSGYPLQRVVAQELLCDFRVTEEWGYLDRESKEHRTLDVFGFRLLSETTGLRLSTVLLVECKRSDLPHMFFEAAAPEVPREFPVVAGLRGRAPELHVDGAGFRPVPVAEFMRLADFAFVSQSPPVVCNSFAKVERKGKGLDLSGATPFNQVVLPLVSALQHLINQYKSAGSRDPVPACLALPICVIDGPMVLVQGGPVDPRIAMCPWIRVVRQEAVEESHWMSCRYYVVDFVHRAYLQTFLRDHLLPFVDQFAERALAQEQLLRAGKASVPNFDAWTFQDLRSVGAG
jgi:hypothetical protein